MKSKDVGICSRQSEQYFGAFESDKIITAVVQKGFWSGSIWLQSTIQGNGDLSGKTAPPAGIKLCCLQVPASNALHQSAGSSNGCAAQIFPDRWEGSVAKVWGWHPGDPWWLPEGGARPLCRLRLGPLPSGSQRVRRVQKGSAVWCKFSSTDAENIHRIERSKNSDDKRTILN